MPKVRKILGGAKPIAGDSFMVKAEPVEKNAIVRRFNKAVA